MSAWTWSSSARQVKSAAAPARVGVGKSNTRERKTAGNSRAWVRDIRVIQNMRNRLARGRAVFNNRLSRRKSRGQSPAVPHHASPIYGLIHGLKRPLYGTPRCPGLDPVLRQKLALNPSGFRPETQDFRL